MLQAVRLNGVTDAEAVADSVNWTELMPEQKLQMDHIHTFDGNAITGVGSGASIYIPMAGSAGFASWDNWPRSARLGRP